jgi:hypothetical protein
VVGRTYYLDGQPVLVVARWSGPGPRNVLVEAADGRRFVRPFRGLRRSPGEHRAKPARDVPAPG